MAPRIKHEEKKVIQELPDEFKILKLDILDYVFSKAQADYYFGLLLGLDLKRSQRRTEELYKKGALIKVHSEKDNKPKFYPTPPTFIFFVDDLGIEMVKKHKKAIEKLEDLYYQKYCNVKDSFLKQRLVFVNAKCHFFAGLEFFLIKKFIGDKEASFTAMDMNSLDYQQIKIALGNEILSKITLVVCDKNNLKILNGFKKVHPISAEYLFTERIAIVGDSYLMQFFNLKNLRDEALYSGYLTTHPTKIKEAKKKFKTYLHH